MENATPYTINVTSKIQTWRLMLIMYTLFLIAAGYTGWYQYSIVGIESHLIGKAVELNEKLLLE